ncbi:MAG: division/cell wall cluster transcriptional repressor MraZ [Rubrimonas sp.]|uniref:division/cell wall cluster transcriptional repressor MraZ n=1 Tax=Rubrimonas sp. TaxID=2036015 RepID=UPI002FDD7595
MKIFSSNSTHKIDAKGRVSIPAPFRKILDREEQPGVVLVPRLRGEPALEGFGYGRFEQMADAIDDMNPLDPAAIALSNKLMGQARHLQVDETGRIVLGDDLRKLVDLKDQALFVGLGKSFQIWNPDAYAARQEAMDTVALENFHRVPWSGRPRAADAS